MAGPAKTVQLETTAIHREADLWDRQAPIMATISTEAHFLKLNDDEAGFYADDFAPWYNDIARLVADRCAEAEDRMNEIRDRLRQIAAAYEANDESHRQNFLRLLP